MYCEKCGQQLPDHATFCEKCGARISDEQNNFQVQEEKPVRTATNNSVGIRRSIIGICLLVGIVIVGGVFFLHREIITFGAYEQDNNHSNGTEPLEWIVLDRQDDKVLLLSRHVIDCQQYHEEYCDITWAECTLREWLNTAFFESAFDEEEQRQIIETEVHNPDNEEYGAPGGVTTYDKVFLLSLEEVSKYTATREEKSAKATAYAMDSNLWTNDENYANWWLRSPGNNSNNAAHVNDCGAVHAYGHYVHNTIIGVRPALWVRIEE